MNILRRSYHSQDPFVLLNDFFSPFFQETEKCARVIKPQIEIKETKQHYTVLAEIPGIAREDIDIQFESNHLHLKGEKKFVKNENNDDEKTFYTERNYGAFQRVIPFSEEINPVGIDATFENGVLRVTLPKKEVQANEPKKINIR